MRIRNVLWEGREANQFQLNGDQPSIQLGVTASSSLETYAIVKREGNKEIAHETRLETGALR